MTHAQTSCAVAEECSPGRKPSVDIEMTERVGEGAFVGGLKGQRSKPEPGS